jgi:hypothetical protein
MMDAATKLGFPFKDDVEASTTFKQMDQNNDGRIKLEEFLEWWKVSGPDDHLRRKIGEKIKFSLEKTATDPSRARGVMFG